MLTVTHVMPSYRRPALEKDSLSGTISKRSSRGLNTVRQRANRKILLPDCLRFALDFRRGEGDRHVDFVGVPLLPGSPVQPDGLTLPPGPAAHLLQRPQNGLRWPPRHSPVTGDDTATKHPLRNFSEREYSPPSVSGKRIHVVTPVMSLICTDMH